MFFAEVDGHTVRRMENPPEALASSDVRSSVIIAEKDGENAYFYAYNYGFSAAEKEKEFIIHKTWIIFLRQ